MKKILYVMSAILFVTLPSFSQIVEVENNTSELSALVFDLSTFTGIVAFVSLAVTQSAKYIPAIASSTMLKIGTSVVVGIAASLVSWKFGFADFLAGLIWWQVLLQGLFAGLTACGAYDLIKNLIGKKSN